MRELVEDDSTPYLRLHALVRGLSPRGAFARASLFNGQEWGHTEEMLAIIAELIDHSNRLYFLAHAGPNETVWNALRIPRPYDSKAKPLTGEALAAAFKGLVDDNEAPVVVYVPANEPPALPPPKEEVNASG